MASTIRPSPRSRSSPTQYADCLIRSDHVRGGRGTRPWPLLDTAYSASAVEPRVIRTLETADLTDRRVALRANWRKLHSAVGEGDPERRLEIDILRDTVEPRIFRGALLC